MGQSLSADPIFGSESGGTRSLMLLVYENGHLSPIPFSNYIISPSLFFEKALVLVEPNSGISPRICETHVRKVSYTELMTTTMCHFSVIPSQTKADRLWIFIPSFKETSLASEIISIIRDLGLEKLSSKIAIEPSCLFFESQIPSSISEALKKKPLTSRRSLLTVSHNNQLNFSPSSFDTNSLGQKILSFSSSSECLVNDSCDLVIPGLFISGEKVASDKSLLQKNGITHILNLSGTSTPVYFPNDFKYMVSNLNDSVFEELGEEFWKALEFVKESMNEGHIVLVHCRMGVSRSAAICIALLIEQYGHSLESAVSFLKKQRPIIDVNSGFLNQINLKCSSNGDKITNIFSRNHPIPVF